MDYPTRSSHLFEGQSEENNGSRPVDSQLPLNVTPLSCVPYSGSPPPYAEFSISPPKMDPIPPPNNQPAMVFLPSHSTPEEWSNIVAAARSGVVLTGSAALGKMGRPLGLVDIAESEDSYVFCVSLPGVARDASTFSCDIDPNGKILIKGVTTTGEKQVHRNNMVFEMQTQNLCPPGEFSISFQLPGPIDDQNITGVFGIDGIFEGVVRKKSIPNQ